MMEGRPMGEEEEEERQERQEKVVQFMEIVGESAERARQFLEVCMVEMHRLLGKKKARGKRGGLQGHMALWTVFCTSSFSVALLVASFCIVSLMVTYSGKM
jgi:hypothetical protein